MTEQIDLAGNHARHAIRGMTDGDRWSLSAGISDVLLPESFRTLSHEGRRVSVLTTTGEQWFDTGFPVIIVDFDRTPPLRRGAFRARPKTFWSGVDRNSVSWHGVFSSPSTNTRARKETTLGPPTAWSVRRAAVLRALQRDWITRGGLIKRGNPDEDLRRELRQLDRSDPHAIMRLLQKAVRVGDWDLVYRIRRHVYSRTIQDGGYDTRAQAKPWHAVYKAAREAMDDDSDHLRHDGSYHNLIKEEGDGGRDLVLNPDEDLRDLERRARQGDRAARARLRAERRRRDLPGGHLPESSRGLYGKARDLSRHAPDREHPGEWVNEEERIHVYETSSDFQVEDIDTGESRGMGDGVDMFHDRRDHSLWPGTREFNEAMAWQVEHDAAELREAYFGEDEEEEEPDEHEHYGYRELRDMDTIGGSQDADLKIDDGTWRIWLTRGTLTVLVEKLTDGRWRQHETYEAE